MPGNENNSAGGSARTVTPELVVEELRTGTWSVYPEYEEHRFRGERRRDDAYVTHKRADLSASKYPAPRMRLYRPLVDEPGLFFRFAEAYDGGVLRGAWRDWIKRYGVLGLHDGSPRGGPEESYKEFTRKAREAHEVLHLYEAAANPRGAGEKYIRDYLHPEKVPEGIAAARDAALRVVGVRVQQNLSQECFPQLYQNADGTFVLSYGFRSLLGAMYIQMSALLSDGATAARWCKAPDCHRIISPDRRRHTEFCNKACLMRWRRAHGRA